MRLHVDGSHLDQKNAQAQPVAKDSLTEDDGKAFCAFEGGLHFQEVVKTGRALVVHRYRFDDKDQPLRLQETGMGTADILFAPQFPQHLSACMLCKIKVPAVVDNATTVGIAVINPNRKTVYQITTSAPSKRRVEK